MASFKMTREKSHKTAVFILTFISYALFHANRKAFSNVKTSTGKVWTDTHHNKTTPIVYPNSLWNSHTLFDSDADAEKYQGYLDTAFMLAYATGLFINGYVGDRVDMRLQLTIGMGSTSVLIFIFGCVCEWTQFYNKYFYMLIWILNGLMQSTGWPVVVACMGNWFGHGSRGLLLGIWSSCASVGNIIGAFLVSSVLSYGYEYAFLVTSSALLSCTLFAFFGLVPSPKDVGMEGPQVEAEEDPHPHHPQAATTRYMRIPGEQPENEPLLNEDDSEDENRHEPNLKSDDQVVYDIQTTKPALSFVKAIFLPGVIPYSLAYAFLKLVNYSFFFWLPLYLHKSFGWPESRADQLSTVYDMAGIVGGTISGYISDRLGKRSVIVVPMLIISIPSIFAYSHSPNNQLTNSGLMALIGFFIGGAANLISAAIAADLGCQSQLSGDDRALSTVTGIIDGTGSLGAAVGQIAVPYLQLGLGWHSVFYMFMISLFLTAACLFPLFVKDMRSFSYSWFDRCCGTSMELRYTPPPTVNSNRQDYQN